MLTIQLIIAIAAIAVVFGLFVFFKKQIESALKSDREVFLELAKAKLETKQQEAAGDLEMKKQSIEDTIKGLKEELDKYKSLMREFEQDRARKYGSLESELKNTSLITNKLQDTTTRLTNVLGNVKLRGQWGERMAEDIINNAGLIEGVNYKKQTKLELSSGKPDYTFLLPDDHKINMDVKFPLNNYLEMINTQNEHQKEQFRKEFIKNVQMRIKEIQDRSYINPNEGTLDFVLLFIPNEQVFGFIQENFPGLMDESLKQKVVLCSPFTLYAMLSVIRQAFENFHYERATKKILAMIDQFAKDYDLFKRRFEAIGQSIDRLENQYSDVKDKSFKKLDGKIEKIGKYKKGHVPSITHQDDFPAPNAQRPRVTFSEEIPDDDTIVS